MVRTDGTGGAKTWSMGARGRINRRDKMRAGRYHFEKKRGQENGAGKTETWSVMAKNRTNIWDKARVS